MASALTRLEKLLGRGSGAPVGSAEARFAVYEPAVDGRSNDAVQLRHYIAVWTGKKLAQQEC